MQREILNMLSENNRMIGLLTDMDYDIRRKREELNKDLQFEYYQSSNLNEELFENKESAYLKKLKAIKARLNSLDIKESLVRHKQ